MNTANIRVETVMIPTYGIGKADKNPMFLEKRVYQGSSGKVYPLPVVDKILDEKIDQPYLQNRNSMICQMILRKKEN